MIYLITKPLPGETDMYFHFYQFHYPELRGGFYLRPGRGLEAWMK